MPIGALMPATKIKTKVTRGADESKKARPQANAAQWRLRPPNSDRQNTQ